MPTVKCPECGERVKYRGEGEKLRCPDCGGKFYAPDEDDERLARKRKPSSNKALITGIIVGCVLLVAVGGLAAFLVMRGKNANSGNNIVPIDGIGTSNDSAKVTAENFKNITQAMTPAEVERILGGGGNSSSGGDMARAIRPDGKPLIWGKDPVPPNRELDWRKWEAGDVRIWVAYLDTKYGKLTAFGLFIESSGSHRNVSSFSNIGEGLEQRLEEAYDARKKVADVRQDPKWVRSAQGQALIPGEWRREDGFGILFGDASKARDYDDIPGPLEPAKRPTYRILNDKQLEVTRRLYGTPDVTVYDYFVFQDELVLIDVTPNAIRNSNAVFYYRMPPKPGGAVHAKLIQPLIADANSPDAKKRDLAIQKLERFGKNGLPALRELERTATNAERKFHLQNTIRAAERRIANDENR